MIKLKLLTWHKEVIDLWENLVNKNKVIQITLHVYQTNGYLPFIHLEGIVSGKPYLLDENFFSRFASEDQDERTYDSVTNILSMVVEMNATKILEDVEYKNNIIFKHHPLHWTCYESYERGLVVEDLTPNPQFVKLEAFTPEIILNIHKILFLFKTRHAVKA